MENVARLLWKTKKQQQQQDIMLRNKNINTLVFCLKWNYMTENQPQLTLAAAYIRHKMCRLNPLNRYRLQRCFLFNTINSAKSQLGCLCHWISLAHPVVRIQGRLSLLPLRLRITIKHGEKTKGCVKIILKTLNYPFRLVIRVLNVCGQSWYA